MAESKAEKDNSYVQKMSQGIWALLIIPILIFGLGFAIYVDSSSSSSAGTTSAKPERSGFVNPNGEASRNPEFDRVRAMPKSAEVPFCIDEEKGAFECTLRPGVWSREVATPASCNNYRIDVDKDPDHYFVWFRDDTIVCVSKRDIEIKNFGIRRGIFRILVEEEGQKLTVTAR